MRAHTYVVTCVVTRAPADISMHIALSDTYHVCHVCQKPRLLLNDKAKSKLISDKGYKKPPDFEGPAVRKDITIKKIICKTA